MFQLFNGAMEIPGSSYLSALPCLAGWLIALYFQYSCYRSITLRPTAASAITFKPKAERSGTGCELFTLAMYVPFHQERKKVSSEDPSRLLFTSHQLELGHKATLAVMEAGEVSVQLDQLTPQAKVGSFSKQEEERKNIKYSLPRLVQLTSEY